MCILSFKIHHSNQVRIASDELKNNNSQRTKKSWFLRHQYLVRARFLRCCLALVWTSRMTLAISTTVQTSEGTQNHCSLPFLNIHMNPLFSYLNFLVLLLLSWNLRKSSDGFQIKTEMNRLLAIFTVKTALDIGLHGVISSTDLLFFLKEVLFFQTLFIVSCVLPLRAQSKLTEDLKNRFSDDRHSTILLSEVLKSPATLMKFREFLQTEFCAENLDFYGKIFIL